MLDWHLNPINVGSPSEGQSRSRHCDGRDDYCEHLDEPYVDDIEIVESCLTHTGQKPVDIGPGVW